MAKLTQTLNGADLSEAVELWLAAKGMRRFTDATVSFHVSQPDRPSDRTEITATVEVVLGSTQPAKKKPECFCGAPSCDICHG